MRPLTGPGWHTEPLGLSQEGALQRLVERCADFTILGTGEPPGPDDARALLEDLPPGRTQADKRVLGLLDDDGDGEPFGVLDLVRGYPHPGDAYLGLLLLAPERRGGGLGTAVCAALYEALRADGARRLLLGVLEHNEGARRFWAREGFELLRRVGPRREGRRENVILELVRPL